VVQRHDLFAQLVLPDLGGFGRIIENSNTALNHHSLPKKIRRFRMLEEVQNFDRKTDDGS
jgi:hypothetical protein